MRKLFGLMPMLVTLVILFTKCASSSTVVQTSPGGTITYQTFYDDLSPYGDWIDYPSYGHVWHPRIAGDFRPYATNGNWAYSNDGWAWQSNYSWGWGPFHYGSWLYDDKFGWLWVPGYDWSPAWVTWGNVDDYYCWAPIIPGLSIGLQFGSWHPNSFYWNVCDRGHIYDHHVGNYIIGRDRIGAIAGRISIINNFHNNGHNFYSRGPDVHDVEKYTNRTISPVKFRDVQRGDQAGHDGNEMRVFRPGVQNPQPAEFKRAEAGQTSPIRDEGQYPSMGREEQRRNIESMPTFRSERPGFGGGGRGGGGGGGRHR